MLRKIDLRRTIWHLPSVALLMAEASLGQGNRTAPDYASQIQPILQQNCVACHGASLSMAKLRLDSEAGVLAGGVSGQVVKPGKSSDSLMIKRVLGLTDAPRMPLNGPPLPKESIALLRAWIDANQFESAKANLGGVPHDGPSLPAVAESTVFSTKIRPILAARCYSCHGAETAQNGLRLDSLAGLLKGSDSGKIVAPGHSDSSRLIRRLTALERPQMPYGGPPLEASQIDVIRAWIDSGTPGPDATTPLAQTAKPPRHWAYVKPTVPAIPTATDASWVRNPIDRFILAKLEREGLKPSPEADKETLLRRVFLDLTGLPPTPRDTDAFLADHSANAYENVVDRLLASPHYGERWARPWLDLARYADSNGYEKDRPRTAWQYRDWVIRALNNDMSFRDFTIDQIAGDMLPNPTPDQLIATGFNRNSMINQEGGIDVEEYYWYSQVDRVNTTASVWLGATLGCAQCHNHKFDPFTQKDYYRFLAFYNNAAYHIEGSGDRWAIERQLELPTVEQLRKSDEMRSKIAALQTVLATETPALDGAESTWEADRTRAEGQWVTLVPDRYESAGGATLRLLPDKSILASGKNPEADSYTITAKTSLPTITGLRIEVLPDPSLPHQGPGRDPDGNFFLSAVDVSLAPGTKDVVAWKEARSDEAQTGYSAESLFQKDPGLHGWAIDATADRPRTRQAVFVPLKPFGASGGSTLEIRLRHQMRHASRNVGRFRISVTSADDPEFLVRLPARVRPMLEIPRSRRTPEQMDQIAAAYRAESPLLDETRKQIADLEQQIKQLGIVTAMVMEERPNFARPATYVRERGSFMSKGDLVYADVPSALGSLPANTMPNRLGLAEWLVSDGNPLTARVAVNHFWETIFGHGIVETAEDFGTQGDVPSHPELLDWLATRFMEDGWSMKKIQRLMVTSACYRQSSHVTAPLIARDPYNKLYARGPRFRVEAETTHDIALSVSGLLSEKMYGPSVFPYQPPGIWNIPYSTEKWVQSEGEDRYRRSIYTFIRRSAPYPSLVTYDAPSREFCTVRRVRTNTPLQALTQLNDPYFFEAAQAMAKRMMAEGGATAADRIAYGFRLAASRHATEAELRPITAFYQQQLERYTHDEHHSPEMAALTMVANVLLNLDETISKE